MLGLDRPPRGPDGPGLSGTSAAPCRPSHHLLLGHGLAVAGAAGGGARPPRIGACVNLSPCEPASDRARPTWPRPGADGHTNRWWLDPLHGRGYPADMVEVYGVEPPVRAGDLATDRRADSTTSA